MKIFITDVWTTGGINLKKAKIRPEGSGLAPRPAGHQDFIIDRNGTFLD